MAINAPFFLDAPDLVTATAVYLDSALTNKAPDGFYGEGTITRQQSAGILLAQEDCATCATPCGTSIGGGGSSGVYQVNLDVGSLGTGAIIVTFDPQSVPDGIRATYDGVVYNKISSPVNGPFQCPNPGHFAIIGTNSTSALSSCGSWYPAGTTQTNNVFLYNPATSSFVSTGGTQTDVIVGTSSAPTLLPDYFLAAANMGQCVMVIPKPSPTPNLVLIEMIGPCTSTGWGFSAACPVALPTFSASNVAASASISCSEALPNTFYFAKVHSAVDTFVGLYDYVFVDVNGQFPLPNGFYSTNNVAVPNKVIEVVNGVVVAITDCVTAVPSCPDRRVVFQICNSNSQKDDNFDIYLNNVYIGAVDLNANAQVGSVFIADLNTAVAIGTPDFVCPLTLMVTYHFNPALLQASNTLEMRNTQNNGNGNAGSIGVRNYQLTGTTLGAPCTINNLAYGGASGQSFTFTFPYTQCCS
jgi:hypothetical protein